LAAPGSSITVVAAGTSTPPSVVSRVVNRKSLLIGLMAVTRRRRVCWPARSRHSPGTPSYRTRCVTTVIRSQVSSRRCCAWIGLRHWGRIRRRRRTHQLRPRQDVDAVLLVAVAALHRRVIRPLCQQALSQSNTVARPTASQAASSAFASSRASDIESRASLPSASRSGGSDASKACRMAAAAFAGSPG
jgi:hypothetical protein